MKCVRKESKLTGELDLFGVGFIAERVCGVVLPGFELSQKGRTNTKTFPSTSTTNSTTTPGGNQTDTTTPTQTPPSPGSNETTTTPTLGSNGTVQTPTPTQTTSPSQSSGAAVANAVVKHVAVPAGMAAVVAFGMSFL